MTQGKSIKHIIEEREVQELSEELDHLWRASEAPGISRYNRFKENNM